MLILAAFTLTLMFARRDYLNPGTLHTAIYCIALAMLLMTSLRGWYVTGHDIQDEYRVFELTKSHGEWNMTFDRDGYNTCLALQSCPPCCGRLREWMTLTCLNSGFSFCLPCAL